MRAPRKPTAATEFEQTLQLIQAILDDEEQRKELLESNGDDAQEWLDLFQLVVEYIHIATKLRSWIFKIMVCLSRRSSRYPKCLTIRGVKRLGRYPVEGGAFGDVWKGSVGKRLVCLKVIRAFKASNMEQLKDYMQEAIIWRQLNHQNLLPFMGIYYLDAEQRQLCLISPWMENGNLVQYLKKTAAELVDHDLLAYDVACGLSYLHEANIVHGDLKGVNILITAGLRACIGDFGLSRVSATQLPLSETSRSKGTMRWLSPELFNTEQARFPSKESDVYAFACVCYEIFTGRLPFYELPEVAIVVAVVMKKQHPSRPEDCAKLQNWMWDTMTACWDEAPTSRPAMVDILTHMSEIRGDVGLEPASDWKDPAFTHIWNDPQALPVVHAIESIRPLDPHTPISGQSQLPGFSDIELDDDTEDLPDLNLRPAPFGEKSGQGHILCSDNDRDRRGRMREEDPVADQPDTDEPKSEQPHSAASFPDVWNYSAMGVLAGVAGVLFLLSAFKNDEEEDE